MFAVLPFNMRSLLTELWSSPSIIDNIGYFRSWRSLPVVFDIIITAVNVIDVCMCWYRWLVAIIIMVGVNIINARMRLDRVRRAMQCARSPLYRNRSWHVITVFVYSLHDFLLSWWKWKDCFQRSFPMNIWGRYHPDRSEGCYREVVSLRWCEEMGSLILFDLF